MLKRLGVFILICGVYGFIISGLPEDIKTSPVPVILLIVLIIGFFVVIKRNNRGEEDRQTGVLRRFKGLHMHGLPVQQLSMTTLKLTNDKLCLSVKNNTFEIELRNIKIAAAMTQSDLALVDKSVAGRAVVGGILLGPVGAIVGGMSGIGAKKRRGNYLIINYVSSTNELSSLVLDGGAISSARKCATVINKVAAVGTVSL